MATAKRLPSGNWRVLVYTGTVDGKRQYKSFTADTKVNAEFQATAYLKGVEGANKPENMTVGQAIDRYIESKDAVLSPVTIRTYKCLRRNDLQGLMQIRLCDLTQEMVQRQINIEAATKSPKSVRSAHGLLAAVLKAYHKSLQLETSLPQKSKRQLQIPTDGDVREIISAVAGTSMEIPVLFAAYLGLRRSEIAALTWDDIDFARHTVRVSKAMVLSAETKWVTKAPKSYSGHRVLPLPGYIEQRLLKEKECAADDKVVHMHPNKITNRFEDMQNKLFGSARFRFHDLRHYNASVMLAQGVPNKYAQERLGHATDNMLKTVYQHLFLEKQKEISESLNSYFDGVMQHEMQHDNKIGQ